MVTATHPVGDLVVQLRRRGKTTNEIAKILRIKPADVNRWVKYHVEMGAITGDEVTYTGVSECHDQKN